MTDTLKRFYPELGAGGFTRIDGTIAFYVRVNALIRPDMVVLDFGAGRGAMLHDDPAPFRSWLSSLQGRVKRLVGVDLDPAVLENPFLDEAHVIEADGRTQFPDAHFDLIFADWVLEHVDNPDAFVAEIERLLKPGGWFCARTPNRWGMNGLATNIVPNRLHTTVLSKLQPSRQERDVFPTRYKLNTLQRLRQHFRSETWENHSYIFDPEPAYLQRSAVLFRLARLYQWLMPRGLGMDLHVFVRKRGG